MPETNTGSGSPGSVSGNWGSLGRKSVLSGWVSGAITAETPRGSVRVARFSDAVNLQTHDGPEDMKLWFADQEVKQLLEVASDVDIDPLVVLKWGGWADWTRFSTTTNARTRQRRSDESVKKSAEFSSIWCLSKRYRSLIALKWMIGAMTNFKK